MLPTQKAHAGCYHVQRFIVLAFWAFFFHGVLELLVFRSDSAKGVIWPCAAPVRMFLSCFANSQDYLLRYLFAAPETAIAK